MERSGDDVRPLRVWKALLEQAAHYPCCGSAPGSGAVDRGAGRVARARVGGVEVENRDGVTTVICRMVDGAPGAMPARWTDLPDASPACRGGRGGVAVGLAVVLERGERLRSRPGGVEPPVKTEVAMSGQLTLAVSEEGDGAGGGVGDAAVGGQRLVTVRMARLLGGGWGRRGAMSEERKITDAHRRRRAVVYVRQSTVGAGGAQRRVCGAAVRAAGARGVARVAAGGGVGR